MYGKKAAKNSFIVQVLHAICQPEIETKCEIFSHRSRLRRLSKQTVGGVYMSQGDDRSSNLAFRGIDSFSPLCFLQLNTKGKKDWAPDIFYNPVCTTTKEKSLFKR